MPKAKRRRPGSWTHELVVVTDFINRGFARDGGGKRLDKLLGHRLDNVLDTLAEALWDDASREPRMNAKVC